MTRGVVETERSPAAPQRDPKEALLTPEEVADQLRVSRPTIYAWLKMGRLKGLRAGKVWRIRPADLEAFLQPESEASDPDAGKLRRYTPEEVRQFLEADQLDPETVARIERLLTA